MSWAAVAALNNSIDEVSATEHATITFDLKSQEKGPLQCNKHQRFSQHELEASETAASALPVTSSSITELQGRTPLFKMITTIVPETSQNPNARKIFMDLPADILIEILKILLVSSRPLVNIPPTQGLVTAESHVPTGINPRILRTCQTMADLGLPILYGYNTFKFSGNIPRVETYHSSQTELLRWLASRIESGEGQNKSGKKRKKNNGIVQRSQLIKNIIITVDREVYDAPAAQKAGRHLREQTDSLIEYYFQTAQFQLATLRCLEFLGMNLRTLTMTFDQDSIAVRKSLKRETVYRSKSTHEKASTFLTGEELTLRSKDLLNLRFLRDRSFPRIWIDLLSFHRIYSARGLQVNKFVVRGVSEPQRPWYLPEDEPREEDVKSS
ncbi:hypothetical protein B0J14DRAFT_564539 [Halenospora varia]|nr:hypothetical protein B0J14DRAFT_564539 [Halenospora varia]